MNSLANFVVQEDQFIAPGPDSCLPASGGHAAIGQLRRKLPCACSNACDFVPCMLSCHMHRSHNAGIVRDGTPVHLVAMLRACQGALQACSSSDSRVHKGQALWCSICATTVSASSHSCPFSHAPKANKHLTVQRFSIAIWQ